MIPLNTFHLFFLHAMNSLYIKHREWKLSLILCFSKWIGLCCKLFGSAGSKEMYALCVMEFIYRYRYSRYLKQASDVCVLPESKFYYPPKNAWGSALNCRVNHVSGSSTHMRQFRSFIDLWTLVHYLGTEDVLIKTTFFYYKYLEVICSHNSAELSVLRPTDFNEFQVI